VILDSNDAVFNDGSFGWMDKGTGGTGAISGVVYNDMNGNKVRDEGEPGLSGIEVALTGDGTASATSDTNGVYGFDGLVAGNYTVTSTGPESWLYTTGPLSIKLDADDSVIENADQGWMEESTGGTAFISGVVFNDMNGNKVKDDGEPGLGGIAVALTGDGTAAATTNDQGLYSFLGLGAGNYTVTSVGPDGWLYTTGPLDIKLDTGTEVIDDAHQGWMEEVGTP